MTAPVYEDQYEVLGVTKAKLKSFIDGSGSIKSNMAQICVRLWDARDSARDTAALQDEATHKMMPRLHVLEKISRAVRDDWKTPNGEACNCQMRIGNPMVSSHSSGCKRMKELLVELDKVSG